MDSAPLRTKIVATIGPASRNPAILRGLSDAGVTVFRLNFSHGTYEEHSAVLQQIRALGKETGQHFAVLLDLCGPKIRLGPIPGDLVECPLGEEFVLAADRLSDDPRLLTCSYRNLPGDLRLGELVLFADGTVAMRVTDAGSDRARLKVTLSGRLRSRQGVNLPNSTLSMQSLTAKDVEDLNWLAKQDDDDVQYIGLSFVRTADDVLALRRELTIRQSTAQHHRQDREAAGRRQFERDYRGSGRRHGGAGRPGSRDGRCPRACHSKTRHCSLQSGASPGHHGHADAQQHGTFASADTR